MNGNLFVGMALFISFVISALGRIYYWICYCALCWQLLHFINALGTPVLYRTVGICIIDIAIFAYYVSYFQYNNVLLLTDCFISYCLSLTGLLYGLTIMLVWVEGPGNLLQNGIVKFRQVRQCHTNGAYFAYHLFLDKHLGNRHIISSDYCWLFVLARHNLQGVSTVCYPFCKRFKP